MGDQQNKNLQLLDAIEWVKKHRSIVDTLKLKALLESKDKALIIYEVIPEAILNRVPSDLKVLFAKVLDKPDGIFLKEEVEELIMCAARGARKLALKDAERFLQKEKTQLKRA